MWGVGTVPFSCILQAYTSLKCAIAKMCPLAKKRKACHSFMPKAESHTILASMMHKPMAGMLLRHPLSLLLLGSKAEVVQLCPEHGKDTCFSQYAHWWWDWAWSGTFSVFNVLVEQRDLIVTDRSENTEFCLILTALEVQLWEQRYVAGGFAAQGAHRLQPRTQWWTPDHSSTLARWVQETWAPSQKSIPGKVWVGVKGQSCSVVPCVEAWQGIVSLAMTHLL